VAGDGHVDQTAVTDEASFERLLRDNPDDAATWSVYADWLESQGQAKRAQVVRQLRKLAETPLDKQRQRLSRARELLTLAKGLSRPWLANLAHRKIDNTCWGARDSGGGVYLIVFGRHGMLHFKQGTPGEDEPDESPTEDGDGTWMQIGDAVTFSIKHFKDARKDFSRQDGVLQAEVMFGLGSNADGEAWRWELHQLDRSVFDGDLPELPDEPADTESKEATEGALLPKRRWD
jgi:uncharacterized protein (TIGR02996 family)